MERFCPLIKKSLVDLCLVKSWVIYCATSILPYLFRLASLAFIPCLTFISCVLSLACFISSVLPFFSELIQHMANFSNYRRHQLQHRDLQKSTRNIHLSFSLRFCQFFFWHGDTALKNQTTVKLQMKIFRECRWDNILVFFPNRDSELTCIVIIFVDGSEHLALNILVAMRIAVSCWLWPCALLFDSRKS